LKYTQRENYVSSEPRLLCCDVPRLPAWLDLMLIRVAIGTPIKSRINVFHRYQRSIYMRINHVIVCHDKNENTEAKMLLNLRPLQPLSEIDVYAICRQLHQSRSLNIKHTHIHTMLCIYIFNIFLKSRVTKWFNPPRAGSLKLHHLRFSWITPVLVGILRCSATYFSGLSIRTVCWLAHRKCPSGYLCRPISYRTDVGRSF